MRCVKVLGDDNAAPSVDDGNGTVALSRASALFVSALELVYQQLFVIGTYSAVARGPSFAPGSPGCYSVVIGFAGTLFLLLAQCHGCRLWCYQCGPRDRITLLSLLQRRHCPPGCGKIAT